MTCLAVSITEEDLLTRAQSIIESCNTVDQVVNSHKWALSVVKVGGFEADAADRMSDIIGFLADSKAKCLDSQLNLNGGYRGR